MRPFDPRLVARVVPARGSLAAVAALGVVIAALVLVQALVIARALAPMLGPEPIDDAVRHLPAALAWLAAIVALRVLAVWLQERLAHRAGTAAIASLRAQVVQKAASLGPRWSAGGRTTEVTTVVTRGLDGLLPYFTRYLPTLAACATVTPLALALVLGLDPLSAVIIAVTLPLVPLFMALVGLMTQSRSARHLQAMARLDSQVLDLVAGLLTLRGLGRSRGPAERVRELGDAHRRATLGSLRIAFLSGMVLELLTTLSVALVAVTMGFRLAGGSVGVETALAVLVLAPEVYLPLRNLGSHFHASADGLAAADAAFALLDETAPRSPENPAPSLTGAVLTLRGLAVATPDGSRLAPVGLDLEARPGQVVALVGPNGDGKSTALLALAGLLPPSEGCVVADGTVLSDQSGFQVDPCGWSPQVAWVPQRPDLGSEGRALSLGERQRVALERAFASGRAVLLLDEPTAHLDRLRCDEVMARLRALADAGATVVVTTHDDVVAAKADAVVNVRSAGVAAR